MTKLLSVILCLNCVSSTSIDYSNKNLQAGAGIGAVTGAIVGKVVGGWGSTFLLGAIGGVVGGAIGYKVKK